MAGTINTGSIAKLLWPGLNSLWGTNYTEHSVEYTDLFDTETSEKAYEEDQLLPGFGLAPIKQEGQGVSYDSTSQGLTSRYTHVTYALGFVITEEAMEDNQYQRNAVRNTKALAFAMRQTKENVAANVYNRAHTAGYTFADGVVLCSTAHSTLAGNQSNRLTTAADLSEASLEDLCVQIMNAVDERGLKISLMPRSLIVPTALSFEATRILKSQLQNDTANNATNALRSMGMFPDGAKVNHYLTDTDAYFVRTNAPDGMKHFSRRAAAFAQDEDFDTSNLKYKASERYSFGNTDFRGVYSNGGGA